MNTYFKINSRFFCFCAAFITSLCISSVVSAKDFDAYWNIERLDMETVDTGGIDVRTDVKVFYQHQMGPQPKFPHDYDLQAILADVEHDVQEKFPDRNATGLGVIDYEEWDPVWDNENGADSEIKKDWRRYIQRTHPQSLLGKTDAQKEKIYKETYLKSTLDFLIAVVQKAKATRPNVKWGLYSYPRRDYWGYVRSGEVGRPNMQDLEERYITDLRPLWDVVDATFPSIYTFYSSEGDAGIKKNNTTYVRENVLAAKRTGAEVYPYIWMWYHAAKDEGQDIALLRGDTEINIFESQKAGADGVVFWGYLPTFPNASKAVEKDLEQKFQKFFPMFRSYWNDRVHPVLKIAQQGNTGEETGTLPIQKLPTNEVGKGNASWCHTFSSSKDWPLWMSGKRFAPPYSVYGVLEKIFVRAVCGNTSATLILGDEGDVETFFFKKGYAFHYPMANKRPDMQNGWWKEISFQGEEGSSPSFLKAGATATIPVSADALEWGTYVATYICALQDGVYKCGCNESGVCSNPTIPGETIWNIQGIRR